MPEQVRYRTKLTQSGIFLVQYRTKIWDARMLMPVLVSSMPMPSYALYTFRNYVCLLSPGHFHRMQFSNAYSLHRHYSEVEVGDKGVAKYSS
jgi:hypothetical protein